MFSSSQKKSIRKNKKIKTTPPVTGMAAKRTVTVVLPAPKVLQARVNHAPPSQGGSHLYAINNQGIEAIIPGSANRTKAIEAALSLAQKKIEDAGKSPDVVSAAKENTEHVLKNSLTALGWSASFKWK